MTTKHTIISLLAGTLLAFSFQTQAAVAGDAAPDWQLTAFSGEEVPFPQAAGGAPSILLFWASWCPYCKALMPYLDEIRAEYAANGVRVFAINVKEDGDPLAFADEHEYKFTYLLSGDDVAEQYAVRFVPGLFVVSGDGAVVFRRKSTELPPGRKVAEYWADQVRSALDESIGGRKQQ